MKKFLVVLSSVALLALVAVPGFTQGHGHWGGGHGGGMGGPGMMLPFMLKKLNLTADQQAKVDQIMASHRQTFQGLFTQMETAHDALAGKLFTSEPLTADDATLTALTGPISPIRDQLMREGLKVAIEVRQVLTPDQLTQASTLHAQMKALHAQERALMGGNQQQ